MPSKQGAVCHTRVLVLPTLSWMGEQNSSRRHSGDAEQAVSYHPTPPPSHPQRQLSSTAALQPVTDVISNKAEEDLATALQGFRNKQDAETHGNMTRKKAQARADN